MDLSERKQKILQAIIDEYIGTAEPVGSRSISKRNELGLSSATIRNEMADLEDMGYLVKPHTSAGRIPSDNGYRFYVNTLMQRYQMSVEAVEQLRLALAERVSQLDLLIKRASVIASAMTDYATVVTSPALSRSVLQKIDLVNMGNGALMLIIVTRAGLVRSKIVAVDISGDTVLNFAALLNGRLSGMLTEKISPALLAELAAEAVTLGVKVEQSEIILSAVSEMIFSIDETDVYINNARSILKYPEFSDVDKAREMLDFLENKENLVKMIDAGHTKDGVRIRIGAENDFKELENSSLVTVDYRVGSRSLGKIGVIGPKRMNYAKVIASLDCISNHIDNILEQLYSSEGEGYNE